MTIIPMLFNREYEFRELMQAASHVSSSSSSSYRSMFYVLCFIQCFILFHVVDTQFSHLLEAVLGDVKLCYWILRKLLKVLLHFLETDC